MKKSQLKQTIKETIKEELDYTDRNQGFLDLKNKLSELQIEFGELPLDDLFMEKFAEYGSQTRLGPASAGWSMGIDKVLNLVKFLKGGSSR